MLLVFFVPSSASWASTEPPLPSDSPSPSASSSPTPEPGPTEPAATVTVTETATPEPVPGPGSSVDQPLYVEPSSQTVRFMAVFGSLALLALGVLVVRSF